MLGITEAIVTTRNNAVNSRRFLHAAWLIGTMALALGSTRCADQPKVRCTATSGEGVTRYKVASGPSGKCSSVNIPIKDPAANPPPNDAIGEAVGIQSYVPSPADPDATNKVNSLALKAEWIGTRIQDAQQNAATDDALKPKWAELLNYPYGTAQEPAPPPGPDGNSPGTNYPYSFGKFDAVYPDANNLCHVPSMSASELDYPDIPKHQIPNPDFDDTQPEDPDNNPKMIPEDEQPATHVKYEWSNISVRVSADSIGTLTRGNVAITQDECSVSYEFALLTPKVGCGKDQGGTQVADPTACSPVATDENPYGSGIGEDISTTCENIGTKDAPDFECLPVIP
jgi:hypothetical protein